MSDSARACERLASLALRDYAMSREARAQEVESLAQILTDTLAAYLETLDLEPTR